MSLEELISVIDSGKTTSEEVYEYFLKRIKKYDPSLKAFLSINKNWFNKENKDKKLRWLPIWVKDIFSEKGVITSWASKMLENFKPPYNSTIIEKLLEEWMSSIWKTNMDEFAMWGSWENSSVQITINPWWKNRIPWGSSSWSAASVAAGLIPASLWTDTGWSTRQPAFLCWIVWFKPTYWRNSRYWIHAMASSLDCPATFTKTVRDASLLYEIMNWEDSKDTTTIPWKDLINPQIWETSNLKWKKIWIPREYFEEWLDQWVKKTVLEAIEKMKELWAEIKHISLPMTKYWVTTYYILMPAEVTTNLARLDWLRYWHVSQKPYQNIEEFYINNRWEWLWNEVKRRIIIWNYVLSAWFYDAYYIKAAQIRTLIIEDFNKAFEEVDVIVAPTSPEVAWKIWVKSDDPLKMYLADAYTIPASLAWLPWISIPCWFAESSDDEKEILPVWIQILAPRLKEESLFEIANVYEKATNWREKMIPKGFE